jgi:hypothetical protein
MPDLIPISLEFRPVLDPEFVPASLWNWAFGARFKECKPQNPAIVLARRDRSVFVYRLVLGRVMTGEGGDLILSIAAEILEQEFPEIAEPVKFHTPSEQEKRHGQPVAAASLPGARK